MSKAGTVRCEVHLHAVFPVVRSSLHMPVTTRNALKRYQESVEAQEKFCKERSQFPYTAFGDHGYWLERFPTRQHEIDWLNSLPSGLGSIGYAYCQVIMPGAQERNLGLVVKK